MFAYIVFIIVILFLKINTRHSCHFLFPFVHERWSILLAHLHVVVYIHSLGNHCCHNCKNHYCRHHNLFPFFLCGASMWVLLFYIILITISLFSGAKVMPFSWISVTKTWQNDEERAFFDTRQLNSNGGLIYVKPPCCHIEKCVIFLMFLWISGARSVPESCRESFLR